MGGSKKGPAAGEMLQGTLDMLILRTLVMGPAHGHTIAQVIENALEVEQGSLYPALHRLEDRGLVSAKWGVIELTENPIHGQLVKWRFVLNRAPRSALASGSFLPS
jgi:hypothetical protein